MSANLTIGHQKQHNGNVHEIAGTPGTGALKWPGYFVAYLNGVTAYKEIVVFIYDESALVQEHDTTAAALCGIDRISDAIIVSRPSQLVRHSDRRADAANHT